MGRRCGSRHVEPWRQAPQPTPFCVIEGGRVYQTLLMPKRCFRCCCSGTTTVSVLALRGMLAFHCFLLLLAYGLPTIQIQTLFGVQAMSETIVPAFKNGLKKKEPSLLGFPPPKPGRSAIPRKGLEKQKRVRKEEKGSRG